MQLLDVDAIGFPQQIEILTCDRPQDTNRKPRSGKWMTPQQLCRQPEMLAHLTHLILEQPLEGLHQFQVHLLRQSTDVMVRLDHRRRSRNRDRFDPVGIQGALSQHIDVADLRGLGFEHVDELTTNDLALLLRIGDTVQRLQKPSGGIDHGQMDPRGG